MCPAQASKDLSVFPDRAREGAAFGHLVEALLKVHQRAGTQPAAPATTTGPSSYTAEKLGDRIGQYTLRKQIGESSCSVVYMAEQREPVRRRVALKLIKPGMDSEKTLNRFETKRQALAIVDHPNIAKVLDTGTTEDGRPFFVLEVVQGIALTQHCELHELSIEARLGLFVQVCLAIHYSHQRGLIHGDIKPSNILLANSEPGTPAIPKVIGFGMTEDATDGPLGDKANTGGALGQVAARTLVYLSPEQARASGAAIDTRSDIYSLGVVLYELLTGRTPFESSRLAKAGVDEIGRMIAEEVLRRPSTRMRELDTAVRTELARQRRTEGPKLLKRLRGDLDGIVMKCLEKDPVRRYETAEELAQDIQRYLCGEQVFARPPSGTNKFRKTIGLLHKVGLMWIA